MTPDEVLRALEEKGIRLSRRTLQRWTKARLVPTPMTGSLGRGRGRFTDYPPETPAEAAASWGLLHQAPYNSPAQVAEVRMYALWPYPADFLRRIGLEPLPEVPVGAVVGRVVELAGARPGEAVGGSRVQATAREVVPYPLWELILGSQLESATGHYMLREAVLWWIRLRDAFSGRAPTGFRRDSPIVLALGKDGAYRLAVGRE